MGTAGSDIIRSSAGRCYSAGVSLYSAHTGTSVEGPLLLYVTGILPWSRGDVFEHGRERAHPQRLHRDQVPRQHPPMARYPDLCFSSV